MIFRQLEVVEGSIYELQEREEQKGGLSKQDLSELCHQISKHLFLGSRRFLEVEVKNPMDPREG